jgi:hypothetical protein
MNDDAAKPAGDASNKPPASVPPAPVPPASTPVPTESLAATPAVVRPSDKRAPAQVPPPASDKRALPTQVQPPRDTAKPAQVPPSGTPAPTESLDAAPAPKLPSDPPAPAQVPPPAPAVTSRPNGAQRAVEPITPVAPTVVHHGSRGLAVLLALVCVLTLVGAGYLYWLSRLAATDLVAHLNTVDQSLTALQQRVASMDQRLAAVERRPVAPPVDLGPLDQRLTALEQKPPPVAQLDQAGHAEIASLAGRVDQVTAREDQLGVREQTDIAKLGNQLTAQDTRIAEQDAKIASASQLGSKATGQVDALTTREARLAALQSASGALAAGRPLGPIPGAPPALAQFADKPPPTEAALRLSFAQAAQAAHEAGMPAKQDAPLLDRMWARVQGSLTVRQGDRVIVGDVVSGVLAHAQAQLDAGDLAGAVATLGELSGPAAAAMAPWRQQAQALLDARAALLTLARG